MHSSTLRNHIAVALFTLGCLACSNGAKSFKVGGTVSGLTSGDVVLSLNGTSTITVAADGAFEFPTAIAAGESYTVAVDAVPTRTLSTVNHASGTVSGTVTDVAVQLEPGYLVGGTANGLLGQTVLRLNGGHDLTVAADGAFEFPTLLPSGAAYVVTVATPAPGQTAQVNSGTGTIASADVGNVGVRGRNWTLPSSSADAISPNGSNADDVFVAAAGQGDMIAVWGETNGNSFQLYKSEFRNGAWTHPADLNDFFSVSGGYVQNHAVVMNDAGDTVIVWSQWFGSGNSRIFKSEYRGGVWSHPGSQLDAISPAGHSASHPSVAIDNLGDTVICWYGSDGTHGQIFKSEYRNGAWTHPSGLADNISVDGTDAYSPSVAMDSLGHALIAWEQDDGDDYRIFKSEYSGGSWTHPATLQDAISPAGDDSWDARVVASGAGEFAIAFNGYDGNVDRVYCSTYANSVWNHPATFNDSRSLAGTDAYSHSIAMAPNGDIVLAWAQYDGVDDDQIYKSEFRSGSWTDPTGLGDHINPTGVNTGGDEPYVACDAEGNAVIAWGGWDNFGSYIYKSQYCNGSWTHPSSTSDTATPYAPNAYAYGGRVAFDGLGNAILGLTAYDGAYYRAFLAHYR